MVLYIVIHVVGNGHMLICSSSSKSGAEMLCLILLKLNHGYLVISTFDRFLNGPAAQSSDFWDEMIFNEVDPTLKGLHLLK
ncbi:hypothetical protein L1987_33927 [Smallanthus sonchifolius]|uniref:Uncharacterized protein n=1 Tax=Smallanthus sonchifolius TaxID=185202 RepID=A0ACB9HSF8_9ASTR|nr:hypothetical protein L1987_33927 [Smallanthus sonchifolius]